MTIPLPPRAVLEPLLDLARKGELIAIRERARALEREDQALAAFAQRLIHLVDRFDEDAILNLLR